MFQNGLLNGLWRFLSILHQLRAKVLQISRGAVESGLSEVTKMLQTLLYSFIGVPPPSGAAVKWNHATYLAILTTSHQRDWDHHLPLNPVGLPAYCA